MENYRSKKNEYADRKNVTPEWGVDDVDSLDYAEKQRRLIKELEHSRDEVDKDFLHYKSYSDTNFLESTSSTLSLHNNLYHKAMIAMCFRPLRKGITTENIVKTLGFYIGMQTFDPSFNKSVKQGLARTFKPVLDYAYNEAKDNDGLLQERDFKGERFGGVKSFIANKGVSIINKKLLKDPNTLDIYKGRIDSMANGGRYPFSPQSAANKSLQFTIQVSEAMRKDPSKTEFYMQSYEEAMETLYAQAAHDGIPPEMIDHERRLIVGRLLRGPDAPMYKMYFEELAKGEIKRAPMEVDPEDPSYKVWKGAFLSDKNEPYNGFFSPRKPKDILGYANDYKLIVYTYDSKLSSKEFSDKVPLEHYKQGKGPLSKTLFEDSMGYESLVKEKMKLDAHMETFGPEEPYFYESLDGSRREQLNVPQRVAEINKWMGFYESNFTDEAVSFLKARAEITLNKEEKINRLQKEVEYDLLEHYGDSKTLRENFKKAIEATFLEEYSNNPDLAKKVELFCRDDIVLNKNFTTETTPEDVMASKQRYVFFKLPDGEPCTEYLRPVDRFSPKEMLSGIDALIDNNALTEARLNEINSRYMIELQERDYNSSIVNYYEEEVNKRAKEQGFELEIRSTKDVNVKGFNSQSYDSSFDFDVDDLYGNYGDGPKFDR